MKAMILAAGLGTRLKPLTETLPKALVPLHGEPLLGILLRKLQQQGFTEVVVNVHHFAAQIRDYLQAHTWGCRVYISDETGALLDTGGAIRHASPYLLQSPQQPVLVHNVDILSNVDLCTLYHKIAQHQALLLVNQRPSTRGLMVNPQGQLVGWVNKTTHQQIGPPQDEDPSTLRTLAFAGIHVLAAPLIAQMQSYPAAFPIIPFYLEQRAQYDIYCHEDTEAQLLDVGKIGVLAQAEAFLTHLSL